MLRISREQRAALEQTERDAFRERALAKVRAIFSARWVSNGDERSTVLVDEGLARATHYGFSSEQDAFRFVALMLLMGTDFDADPRFPWVRSILDDSTMSGWQKMSALMDGAVAHLRGFENESSEESEPSRE